MPKESIITVFRSTSTDTPTGLTFGELAYSDLNGKLFIGKNDGTSLWVGAGITSGTIGNNQYLVPTQSAVKSYVDGIIGGGSVVNSVNGSSGAVTITGDGGAITNVQSGGANTIRVRLASTSATGAASFSSTNFDVSGAGAVSIKTGGVSNTNLANSTISGVSLGNNLNTLTIGSGLGGSSYNGSSAVTITNTGVLSFNGSSGSVTYSPAIASASVTGVASFSTDNFAVSAGGAVTIKNGGVENVELVNSSVTVSAGTGLGGGGSVALGSSVTLTNLGVTSLNGLTGARTLTGDGGAIVGVNNDTIRARLSSTSLTGVASFSSTNFDVSGAGAVSVKTGGISNTNLANSTISGVSLGSNLNTLTIGTGLGGSSYNGSGAVTITNNGVLSFNGSSGTVTYSPAIASASVTGVASFSTDNFAVSAGGAVTIKDGGVANAELVNSTITFKDSSGDAGQAVALGSNLTIQGSTNQVSVTRSGSTLTVGLPNDVTIAGNLTVNGTVVTANVDNFTVEDPLITLGTGNASDSVDLGFVGKYSGTKFSGLFRDASDSGKFKLFSELTVEPTTTVNTGGAGYAMATLVARIDGGTF